jgi:hypothetical protein
VLSLSGKVCKVCAKCLVLCLTIIVGRLLSVQQQSHRSVWAARKLFVYKNFRRHIALPDLHRSPILLQQVGVVLVVRRHGRVCVVQVARGLTMYYHHSVCCLLQQQLLYNNVSKATNSSAQFLSQLPVHHFSSSNKRTFPRSFLRIIQVKGLFDTLWHSWLGVSLSSLFPQSDQEGHVYLFLHDQL